MLNCDEFNSEGLLEKHSVVTWNLGTISAFAGRQRKTMKYRMSRWPIAGPSFKVVYCLLASC